MCSRGSSSLRYRFERQTNSPQDNWTVFEALGGDLDLRFEHVVCVADCLGVQVLMMRLQEAAEASGGKKAPDSQ